MNTCTASNVSRQTIDMVGTHILPAYTRLTVLPPLLCLLRWSFAPLHGSQVPSSEGNGAWEAHLRPSLGRGVAERVLLALVWVVEQRARGLHM